MIVTSPDLVPFFTHAFMRRVSLRVPDRQRMAQAEQGPRRTPEAAERMGLTLGALLRAMDDPGATVALRFDQESPGLLNGRMGIGYSHLAECVKRHPGAEGVAGVGPEPAPAAVGLLSRQNPVTQRFDLLGIAKLLLDQQPQRIPLAAYGRDLAVGRSFLEPHQALIPRRDPLLVRWADRVEGQHAQPARR